jgi:putative endonuclease
VPKSAEWYAYIVSNANRTLYVGMAADLIRRVEQHKKGTFPNAFTRRYNFDRLVYFESSPTRSAAAKRERQIKSWPRARKVALIEAKNPDWRDLSVSWMCCDSRRQILSLRLRIK